MTLRPDQISGICQPLHWLRCSATKQKNTERRGDEYRHLYEQGKAQETQRRKQGLGGFEQRTEPRDARSR